MTMTSRTEPRSGPKVGRLLIGGLWLAGGALWIAAGIADGGSLEPIWIAADVLLLAGLLGLWTSPSNHPTRAASMGLGIAIAGRVCFIAAELLAIVQASDENALLPLAALSTAVGMTLFGAAILRHRAWPGASRFSALAMGVYPFVAMFPYVAVTGEPSIAAITVWGIPTMLVGLAIVRIPELRSAPKAIQSH